MSNDAFSWPLEGWPAPNHEVKWQGLWNGRFGMGVIYADLECFFVANDAQDQEYLQKAARVKYHPRPGKYINADNTSQPGAPWGGLGIRVEQRGMQWNNPQARDAIFWEYTIANISDYTLNEVAFGYWVDNAIGDDANDEIAAFDKIKDLAYSWDINGVGQGGNPTGTMGFAFLESPGIGWDGSDNDDDGIIDEKRDNLPARKLGPTEGYESIEKFLSYNYLKQSDLREHWDADEDQDWDDGEDANGNGVYDLGENPGDDVGLDGVGPGELQYPGPDRGEANHQPDFEEGYGCEPDFAATDISESDMLGLTSFRLYPIPPEEGPTAYWFRHDRNMWQIIGMDSLVEYKKEISNLVEAFASGVFPLYRGRTERISMSELHSYDPLQGLQSESHEAPALFNLKRIVQLIYERDYRFAQPPRMPTLTATPGDGRVVLTWDNIADQRTREPFLNNINDFEGYKLYRSTDRKMTDSEQITDGFGTKMFKKAIFQCDLKDGKSGFTEFGLVNGMGFYLGDDKGITHAFVDNTVQNGRTYYYALVAYDYGIPPEMLRQNTDKLEKKQGISPSENNAVIELDEAEEVKFIGQNVAIVVPGPKPAGQEARPDIEVTYPRHPFGDGKITPEAVAENALKVGKRYAVVFHTDTVQWIRNYTHGVVYSNNGLRVLDVSDSKAVVYEDLVKADSTGEFTTNYNTIFTKFGKTWHIANNATTGLFEGMRLTFAMPSDSTELDAERTGWNPGTAPINLTFSTRETRYYSWDYNIVFTDQADAYTGRVKAPKTLNDENGVRLDTDLLSNLNYNFYVENVCFWDSTLGNYERMDLVVHDLNRNGQFDWLEDRIFVGAVNDKTRWVGTVFIIDFRDAVSAEELPKAGDVYQVRFHRPFWPTDTLWVDMKGLNVTSGGDAKQVLDQVRVVPNPYVATNAMEPAVANNQLNQRRRIMFTHVPAKCTIKIFTMSGIQVSELRFDSGVSTGFVTTNGGMVHWDMKTSEGTEIAAGVYLFHLRDEATGEEKLGTFAVIK
jgi:hypothetical protein